MERAVSRQPVVARVRRALRALPERTMRTWGPRQLWRVWRALLVRSALPGATRRAGAGFVPRAAIQLLAVVSPLHAAHVLAAGTAFWVAATPAEAAYAVQAASRLQAAARRRRAVRVLPERTVLRVATRPAAVVCAEPAAIRLLAAAAARRALLALRGRTTRTAHLPR